MLSLALAAALTLAPTSTEVTLASTPAPLHGTLLAPEGTARAVAVILPGSGPTDRDGNSAVTRIAGSTYRLLAEGLVERGVATIRIDKRGIGASAPAGLSEAELRFNDYATDARAWAAEAAARAGQPCAWLIGHSEGALVVLAAVRVPDDKVCGLVLISGAGRPAAVAIADQLAGVPEPMKTQALAALDDLAAGRETANIPGLESLFRPSVQPYLISWFALDPAALAAAYDGPVLIMQGTTDLQITMTDAEALAAARPDAALVRLEGVNHVLKVAPIDRAANLATYFDANLPLAPGVTEAVADFILAPR